MRNRIIVFSPSSIEMNGSSGGVSNAVLNISREYSKRGFDVVIICLKRELSRKIKSANVVKEENITRYACSSIIEVITTFLRVARYDAVLLFHIHGYFNIYSVALPILAKAFGQKVLITMHGKFASGFLKQQQKKKKVYNFFITKQLAKFIDVASAMSSDEMKNLVNSGFKNNILVQNGINDLKDEVLPKGRRQNQVLFLGCIEPRKQPLFVIEVIQAIREKGVAIKLVIAGPDDFGHKKEVEKRISDYGLTEHITILDFVSGFEKEELISSSLFTILPSTAEGHPLVLCESISNGTPCLFSQNSNFPQIATHNCGVEVDGFDVNDWVSGALDILSNEKYYDRKNYVSLSQNVSWSSAADKYLMSVV